MDKNTIIGLLLITAIIIGFSIYNRPSQEQLATQQRMRDSLALVEQQRAVTTPQESAVANGDADSMQGSSAADFFGAATTTTPLATDTTPLVTDVSSDTLSPGSLVQKSAETVILENEKVRIQLSTLGGSIRSVQLKEYLRHTGDSLYLF